jgi:hypothetical protein
VSVLGYRNIVRKDIVRSDEDHLPAGGERVPGTSSRAPASDLGVFGRNRRRPVHRWLPFVEGYSSALVDQALEAAPAGAFVFDPFAGSGTTPLRAVELGYDAAYTEVNPYLAWATDVKVNQSRRLDAVDALRRVAARAEKARLPKAPAHHPLLRADTARGYFPTGVATTAVRLLAWIERELDGAAREIATLALTTSLVPSSNMIRRADLRRRTPADPPPQDLIAGFAAQLHNYCDDLVVRHGLGWSGMRPEAVFCGADARGSWVLPRPADVIVTSPPYLNGTNYCRNTKLELLLLSLLDGEQDLATLRAACVAGGINAISRRRTATVTPECVRGVVGKLRKAAYDPRIPVLVENYFADMAAVFAMLRAHAADAAQLHVDIGDSRYAGVHVPTHDLLGEIATSAGWSLKEERALRQRRSHDGTPLVQVLLVFGVH